MTQATQSHHKVSKTIRNVFFASERVLTKRGLRHWRTFWRRVGLPFGIPMAYHRLIWRRFGVPTFVPHVSSYETAM